MQLRWDTTLRTSLGVRTEGQSAALLRNPNADDGDRAFNQGPMSERVDVLSQADLLLPQSWLGEFGIGASADGWYDAAYHGRTANRSPATFNPISVPNTRFPKDVQALEGNDAELLTAMVHDSFKAGGIPVTVRLGRQTLLWGESLFSTENGIAAGQAPVDGIKALSQPLAEAKELFLPVAQAVVTVAPCPGIGLEAYIQPEWRPNRLPGVGSFFSTTDILDVGGQRLLDGKSVFLRTADRGGEGAGQFGAALKVRTGAVDFGLYALRFDAKSPQIFVVPNGLTSGPVLGRYGLLYPRGIGVLGGSFASYLGDSTVAGEFSVRTNMPLVSRLPPLSAARADAALPFAKGTTLHGQVSSQITLVPQFFWQGATMLAELTANSVLAVTRDPAAAAPGRQRSAAALRFVFTPQYFQVLPQLDISLPVALAYDIAGSSAVLADQTAHSGSAEFGIDATWHTVWTAALTYSHFLGGPARQPLADRDFVVLALSRTF